MLARHLNVVNFADLVHIFFHDQLRQGDSFEDTQHLPIPIISSGVRFKVFHSAKAVYYAPGDPSGEHGMRREVIRANPRWRNGESRYDCVFVSTDQAESGMKGLDVGRVKLFFSFTPRLKPYDCALVHWYKKTEACPDSITGLWKVAPEYLEDGSPKYSVIHVDTIFRAAHLMPVFTDQFTPASHKHTQTLDNYNHFFVNRYIDHHAHQFIF